MHLIERLLFVWPAHAAALIVGLFQRKKGKH